MSSGMFDAPETGTSNGPRPQVPRHAPRRKPLVSIQFTSRPPGPADALVLGMWEGGNPTASTRALGAADWITTALEQTPSFTGKSGNVILFTPPIHDATGTPLPPRLVVAGLGQFGAMDAETARRCGAEVGAVLAANGVVSASVDLGMEPAMAAFFALGLRLRAAPTVDFTTRDNEEEKPLLSLVTIRVSDHRQAEATWANLSAVADGVELARTLSTLPGNHLTPTLFAAHARAQEPLGLEVEILSGPALQEQGLNLHYAVGQASNSPPCLVTLRWKGADDLSEAPVLVVGKGITFDTGGLCLKSPAGMVDMKSDMAGAAVVLGLMRALALSEAPVNVTGILAVAENAIDGHAMRPSDVLTAYNGMTVEIIDTDAEGRLVLADALAYGCEREKPKAVIDIATLTGTIVVALADHMGGLFSNDDKLAKALMQSGEYTDELLWRMPLTDAVDEDLKSTCADIKQCADFARLLPDSLHASRFLSHFVPEGTPWAHLDICGVFKREKAHAHMPAGETGFGLLCLYDWLTSDH